MKWWFYALLFGPFLAMALYLQWVAHNNSGAVTVVMLAAWTAWFTSGYLKE